MDGRIGWVPNNGWRPRGRGPSSICPHNNRIWRAGAGRGGVHGVRRRRVRGAVGVLAASGEETQPAGAGGSAWRKYMFRRHQDQPSVPVSPGHRGLTVVGRQQQAEAEEDRARPVPVCCPWRGKCGHQRLRAQRWRRPRTRWAQCRGRSAKNSWSGMRCQKTTDEHLHLGSVWWKKKRDSSSTA